jgi:hypothetical protein
MRRNMIRTWVMLAAILLLLRDVCLEPCSRLIEFSQITCSSLCEPRSCQPGALRIATGIASLAAVALQDEPSPYAVTFITDTRGVF